jgi:hypothetical protein
MRFGWGLAYEQSLGAGKKSGHCPYCAHPSFILYITFSQPASAEYQYCGFRCSIIAVDIFSISVNTLYSFNLFILERASFLAFMLFIIDNFKEWIKRDRFHEKITSSVSIIYNFSLIGIQILSYQYLHYFLY